jgi:chemotaxis protein CheX
MIGAPVKMAEKHETITTPHPPDIIGVIGLSGSAQGMVALRFPDKSALAIIGQMVGTKFDEVDSAIVDGVGELVNMVAGSAKAKFRGHSISISLPTVVRGDICRLSNMNDAMWMELEFRSELGDFWLIVSLKAVEPKHQEVAHEGARR